LSVFLRVYLLHLNGHLSAVDGPRTFLRVLLDQGKEGVLVIVELFASKLFQLFLALFAARAWAVQNDLARTRLVLLTMNHFSRVLLIAQLLQHLGLLALLVCVSPDLRVRVVTAQRMLAATLIELAHLQSNQWLR